MSARPRLPRTSASRGAWSAAEPSSHTRRDVAAKRWKGRESARALNLSQRRRRPRRARGPEGGAHSTRALLLAHTRLGPARGTPARHSIVPRAERWQPATSP